VKRSRNGARNRVVPSKFPALSGRSVRSAAARTRGSLADPNHFRFSTSAARIAAGRPSGLRSDARVAANRRPGKNQLRSGRCTLRVGERAHRECISASQPGCCDGMPAAAFPHSRSLRTLHTANSLPYPDSCWSWIFRANGKTDTRWGAVYGWPGYRFLTRFPSCAESFNED
jgi:hypothetical protein